MYGKLAKKLIVLMVENTFKNDDFVQVLKTLLRGIISFRYSVLIIRKFIEKYWQILPEVNGKVIILT